MSLLKIFLRQNVIALTASEINDYVAAVTISSLANGLTYRLRSTRGEYTISVNHDILIVTPQ